MYRIIMLAALAVAVAWPSVAVAQRADHRSGCVTLECKRRVAKEHKVHRIYSFCNTWKCVQRVKVKREWREWRGYRAHPLPWCTWGPESPGYPEWSRARYRVWNTGSTSYSRASGKYQVIRSTWHAFGGAAYADVAAYAAPVEQERVARRIAADSLGHWVHC